MQRIYAPADLIEAELLGGMLANEGISSHLGGRHLVGGIGELPGMGLLHLWVEDDVAERARELIAAYNAAQPLPGIVDDPDGGPGVLLC
ncbi:putative signal transducing protein [Pseudomonas nicosulfuronedens]